MSEPVPPQVDKNEEKKLEQLYKNYTRLYAFSNVGDWYLQTALKTNNENLNSLVELSPDIQKSLGIVSNLRAHGDIGRDAGARIIEQITNSDAEQIRMHRAMEKINACVRKWCIGYLRNEIDKETLETVEFFMKRSNIRGHDDAVKRFKQGTLSKQDEDAFFNE